VGLPQVSLSWGGGTAESWRYFWDPNLRQMGCAFLASPSATDSSGGANLCLEYHGWPTKPLSIFCPCY